MRLTRKNTVVSKCIVQMRKHLLKLSNYDKQLLKTSKYYEVRRKYVNHFF